MVAMERGTKSNIYNIVVPEWEGSRLLIKSWSAGRGEYDKSQGKIILNPPVEYRKRVKTLEFDRNGTKGTLTKEKKKGKT